MTAFLQNVVVDVVGWTLIHLTWQAVLIYALLVITRAFVGLGQPRIRYALCCAALAAVVVAGTMNVSRLATAASISNAHAQASAGATAKGVSRPSSAVGLIVDRRGGVRYPAVERPTVAERVAEWINPWVPDLVGIWACGVFFVALRHLNGIRESHRILKTALAVSEAETFRFQAIADSLHLNRVVRFLRTDRPGSPYATGWIKPVVVLPFSLMNHCTLAEVDAIVAHELSHLRRADRLVDLAQLVLETILCGNVGVLLICRALDDDRELCSDAAAYAYAGGGKAYAKLLLRLQDAVHVPIRTQAAFLGSGSLLQRIKAIGVRQRPQRRGGVESWAALAASAMCVIVIGASAAHSAATLSARRQFAMTPEWQFIAKTLRIEPAASDDFAKAYQAGLAAASDGAPLGDPRYTQLLAAAEKGVDVELVWRTYVPLMTETQFPVVPAEFPPGWPYADAPTHADLVSSLWKLTKRLESVSDRRSATAAVLAIASMRREEMPVLPLRSVLTDPAFATASGLSPSDVTALRLYWSAAQDAAGLAVKEIQRRYREPGADDAALIACGERIPSLWFVARYLRDHRSQSGNGSQAGLSPAIVDRFTPQSTSR